MLHKLQSADARAERRGYLLTDSAVVPTNGTNITRLVLAGAGTMSELQVILGTRNGDGRDHLRYIYGDKEFPDTIFVESAEQARKVDPTRHALLRHRY